MQQTNLRAVVIGAGWAGQGHTKALQANGVTVEAICARNGPNVQRVAAQLGVASASTDWRKTINDYRPDIVTLAIPATQRREMVAEATALGCHIFCEKPLAATAEEARELLQLVQKANVRHAYGATHCYGPCVAWTAELVAGGIIGRLREIHYIEIQALPPERTPWTWFESLALGGGSLNNGGTHLFALFEQIIGGPVVRATGITRTLRQKAPVLPGIHDFRQVFAGIPETQNLAALEWRACDVDHSYTILLECRTGAGEQTQTIPVMAHVNYLAHSQGTNNGWTFYGAEGLLFGEGGFTFTLTKQANGEVETQPIPQRLLDALPQTGDGMQDKWNALFADFVADIRSEKHKRYPTFADGVRYQEMIEAIRQGTTYIAD